MHQHRNRRWLRVVVALLAGLLVTGAIVWPRRHAIVAGLFGPPHAILAEIHPQRPDAPAFEHQAFGSLLGRHVDDDGWIDYEGLLADAELLDRYLASLAAAPFDLLGRDQKLALLINAYNAFTLRLILDHYPIDGIREIPASDRWDAVRWTVGGMTWSLNEIEHEQIRSKFREPRIHFALVCAAVGCPPLRNEAYAADRLESQLHEQAAYLHRHRTWFEYSARSGRARMTQLYLWYEDDFTQTDDSLLDFVARYSPELRESLADGATPQIAWLDYDWKLNAKTNREPR